MLLFEAIQLRAAAAHLKPDYESWLRSVHRWYSRQYSTPLHVVPDLPTEDILLAYFEGILEQMSPEDRFAYFDRLALTEKEVVEEEKEEAQAGEAGSKFFEQLNAEVKAGAKLQLPKGRRKMKPVHVEPPPEPPKNLPPDIHMTFGESSGGNLLDEIGHRDPLLPPTKVR